MHVIWSFGEQSDANWLGDEYVFGHTSGFSFLATSNPDGFFTSSFPNG